MNTILTGDPLKAAAILRAGHLVAFPTETVYGLGADAFNVDAVGRIFQAKQRPADNPLIVHVADPGQIDRVVFAISPAARILIRECFPGPVSIIAKKRPEVPSMVTGALDTVAVRMPEHPLAQEFLRACRTPVAAPSANLSGRPSPTTWQAVHEDLGGRISCLLRNGHSQVGLESTVVDCSQALPVVLRTGAVTIERLRELLPSLAIADASIGEVRSPGLQYRHYAPRASVKLVTTPSDAIAHERSAYIGLAEPSGTFGMSKVCPSVEAYAHSFFDFFRRCEAEGMQVIYCQEVPSTGIGRALMDRLTKASNASKASNAPVSGATAPGAATIRHRPF